MPIGVQAPQIKYPGAITFGFKTLASSKLKSMTSGPLEENMATCCAAPEYLVTSPLPILAVAPKVSFPLTFLVHAW